MCSKNGEDEVQGNIFTGEVGSCMGTRETLNSYGTFEVLVSWLNTVLKKKKKKHSEEQLIKTVKE